MFTKINNLLYTIVIFDWRHFLDKITHVVRRAREREGMERTTSGTRRVKMTWEGVWKG
jgi:hypothetical protein